MNKKLLVLGFCTTMAIAAPTILQVQKKEIIVNGKKAQVLTIVQPNGTWGYYAKSGEDFNVIVENKLNESTVIHWHGLDLPNNQDGTELTQLAIPPHGKYSYNFKLKNAGTFWMHSHFGLQEVSLAAAPLIIESQSDSQYKQVVVLFQDFSFKTPETILSGLTKASVKPMDMSGMNMGQMDHMPEPATTHTNMANMHETMKMDLNDVDYDAFLTNYHTPNNPQITKVNPGDKVKLRFINASASSNFWLNLGKLSGTVTAVDGHDTKPYTAKKYQLSEGQRMDIIVTVPKGTFPIIGQVEGLKNQTGLILTTESIKNTKIKTLAKSTAPEFNDQQELHLQSIESLPKKPIDKIIKYKLTGDMATYTWKINNQLWPNITPVKIKQGQRVELDFINDSMMSHPMHLHGYGFKVVEVDGHKIDGAIRDTIEVLPDQIVKVIFDANNPGKWFLHCHIAWHMPTGMMTYIEVVK